MKKINLILKQSLNGFSIIRSNFTAEELNNMETVKLLKKGFKTNYINK